MTSTVGQAGVLGSPDRNERWRPRTSRPAGYGEVAVHQIGRRRRVGRALGGLAVATAVCALDPQLPHQAANPLAGAVNGVVISKLVQDSRHPVGESRALVNGADQIAQAYVLLLARTDGSSKGGVVTAGADAQQPTHPSNVVIRLLSLHEL